MSSAELRQKVQELAIKSQEQGDFTGWFETIYQNAKNDPQQIPWAKLSPHPCLENWLNSANIWKNRTALVIGCGLGDDAEALAQKGYLVTAFDVSNSAITWCRQRFPDSLVNYKVANLLTFAVNEGKTFDFVFECRTIQSLPLTIRQNVIEALAPLLSPQGTLRVVTRLRENTDPPSGPPWPLSEQELNQFQLFGLIERQRISYVDPEQPDITQVCIDYQY